ncbi:MULTISPECIES: DUF3311 domain-containing protein [unclassified Crossiella]|uniref:DUF3311 domain-containing protein n=1 Tax=unclassified Crossiella TaxID=2620835 RepID=UPI00207D211F|nr:MULTISPECIES: DUF3311 domain-containing protein [unclassified Crossiella]MCO1579543.1 DUF3311 domain-containing protein [Crossiella sp. SN42]WHT19413.1 DUF3311 domain-containing protein [Crossiella sp. CA-258035]
MPSGSSPPVSARPSGLRWNWWNLLLVVPLLMLVTPMINFDEPRLLGLPFFYWSQFAFVPLGVVCVGLVYLKTRDEPVVTDAPDRLDVDRLDEGDKA